MSLNTMDSGAAYVIEYHTARGVDGNPVYPYGYGESRLEAREMLLGQIAGCTGAMKRAILDRCHIRALPAEEASDIAEYLATPW